MYHMCIPMSWHNQKFYSSDFERTMPTTITLTEKYKEACNKIWNWFTCIKYMLMTVNGDHSNEHYSVWFEMYLFHCSWKFMMLKKIKTVVYLKINSCSDWKTKTCDLLNLLWNSFPILLSDKVTLPTGSVTIPVQTTFLENISLRKGS